MPERDTRFPSAAGYYFSRRIFPQMNFMKTVFALLINRSSGLPFLFARTRCRAREAVEDESATAFSNNIVSETAEKSRDPPAPPFSPGSSVRYVMRDLRKPASFFFLLSRRRKGAPGKIVGR